MSQYFDLIQFTSSEKKYADSVIECFDPDNKYFSHRFYRDHCIKTRNGKFVKDLRIFEGLNLKNCVIVDNTAAHYVNTLSNGIPIVGFESNWYDEEQIKLADLLTCMVKVSFTDFGEFCSRYFKLDRLLGANNFFHGYDLVFG